MSAPRESIAGLLELFDVTADGPDRFTGSTGVVGTDGRHGAKGAQALAQAIVATSRRFPDKVIRSAHAVFARPVTVGSTVELHVDVLHEGRSTATAVVNVIQDSRRCATVTALSDVPSEDVISHQALRPDVDTPDDAYPAPNAMAGQHLRLVDVLDVNSPEHVGPPELYAWLPGVGTAQAHAAVSTALMSTFISFHEPVNWDGWLLYGHESTHAGAGMSYVRGQVHTEDGELVASFAQEGLIRPLRPTDTAIDTSARL